MYDFSLFSKSSEEASDRKPNLQFKCKDYIFESYVNNSSAQYEELDGKGILIVGEIFSINGKKFSSKSNLDILVKISSNGLKYLSELDGQFIVFVFSSEKLLIYTDHFNSIPLFHYSINENNYFSTSLNSFRKILGPKININYSSVAEFFLFG